MHKVSFDLIDTFLYMDIYIVNGGHINFIESRAEKLGLGFLQPYFGGTLSYYHVPRKIVYKTIRILKRKCRRQQKLIDAGDGE